MNLQNIKFILLVLCLFSIKISAQVGLDKLAQSTMNFQLVSTSPKASGMGDAVFALGNGADAIFYNPAGIVGKKNKIDVVINYTQWIADINYLSGALTYNLGNYGSVGISVMTVDYGEIIGTRLIDESQLGQYPNGYIETGPVSNVGAYSFGLSYAKAISEKFSIGGNIRFVGQNLGTNQFANGRNIDNNATKLVFDAGVIYNTGYKNFTFGMAFRNFSSNIKREAIDQQLPTTFTIGAAIDLWQFISTDNENNNELTFEIDFLHSNSYSERVNIGLEYKFLGMVYLRGGYQSNRDIASWCGGIGLSKSLGSYGVEVNYSYSQMEIFDNLNRLSIGLSF